MKSDEGNAPTLPATQAPPPPAPITAPGTRIGRFVVVDTIGVGGMGTVHSAYDPLLDRRVAIKVLRAKPGVDSTGGATRLMREAQAMAQLAHPNVVPVYDVGTFEDSVYMAMELVPGSTLREWLKQQPRAWREIVQVFLGAGRGLQAAHAAGLLHRDFKPPNVMVGADDRPRLTDFGIARSTRTSSSSSNSAVSNDSSSSLTPSVVSLETPLTVEGAVMGSPGYMAPEQYEGADTSAATDQYSFCVSLYEALYGVRPFQGKDLDELRLATRKGDVPPPPRGSKVPAWIFAIIKKGLAPLAAHRHASMAALLAQLQRDPTRVRNLTVASLLGVVLVAAIVLTWGYLAQRRLSTCVTPARKWSSVWDDAVRARAEAAFKDTGRSYSTLAWDYARKMLDGYASDWTAARIDACADTSVRHEQTEKQLALRVACLDRRLDELATLAEAFAGADAELVSQASTAVTQLSPLETCANVKSLEQRERLSSTMREAADAVERNVAEGRMLVAAGRFAAARDKLEPAAIKARTIGVASFEAEAAEALGLLERDASHFSQARAALETAARAALISGDDAASARIYTELVSVVGWRLEKPDEGRVFAAVAEGLVKRAGSDARLSGMLDEGVGDLEWQAGNRPASLDHYRRALSTAIELDGPVSANVARLRSAAGWVLMELGELTQARTELERSRAIREKLLGEEHPSLGYSWNELGTLAGKLGDEKETVRCFEHSRSIHEQAVGPGSVVAVRAWFNLVEAQCDLDDATPAAATLAEARRRLALLSDAPPTLAVQDSRGRALVAMRLGKGAEAVSPAREAVDIVERRMGPDHTELLPGLRILAEALQSAGQSGQASTVYEQVLTLHAKLHETGSQDHALALTQSVEPLLALHRDTDALPRAQQAMAAAAALQGNERLKAQSRFALARALWVTVGDRQRAKAMALEVHETLIKLGRPHDALAVDRWTAQHRN